MVIVVAGQLLKYASKFPQSWSNGIKLNPLDWLSIYFCKSQIIYCSFSLCSPGFQLVFAHICVLKKMLDQSDLCSWIYCMQCFFLYLYFRNMSLAYLCCTNRLIAFPFGSFQRKIFRLLTCNVSSIGSNQTDINYAEIIHVIYPLINIYIL